MSRNDNKIKSIEVFVYLRDIPSLYYRHTMASITYHQFIYLKYMDFVFFCRYITSIDEYMVWYKIRGGMRTLVQLLHTTYNFVLFLTMLRIYWI